MTRPDDRLTARYAAVNAAALACPVCRGALLFSVAEDGSADHRRVCRYCGCVVKLPRVPLARALRKATR